MEQRRKEEEDRSNFRTGQSAQEKGYSHVPECYKLPRSRRPSLTSDTADIPVVDLTGMKDPAHRPFILQQIATACRLRGFFQVTNHGIPQNFLDGALSAASGFFNLPTEEKMKFMSSDVHKPVRYSSSIRDGVDKIQFWRVFLKHYSNPLSEWLPHWPNKPQDYREKMGQYSVEVQKLAIDVMGAITESLGLGSAYLSKKLESGVQVMGVNCYPPCPQPRLALGLPPHSDYSCLTILLQSSGGLEILDKKDGQWKSVPYVQGALQVHVGDHLEVLSNGLYQSVVHRAVLNSDNTRISIASLHSLAMDEKMKTAEELVDDDHNPRGYKESSVRDFLNFLSKNSIGEGRSFLQTLKIKQ